jgi:hypothetical protein
VFADSTKPHCFCLEQLYAPALELTASPVARVVVRKPTAPAHQGARRHPRPQ